jgi:S-adenosylmethionine:tRNA ribosyltransferase-isomerase
MNISEFDYNLPNHLIAQYPIEPRDHCNLMVIDSTDGTIKHHKFYDLPKYISEGDVLVFNDTKVIPARLYGRTEGNMGKFEILLLEKTSNGEWKVLVKPGRRMRKGVKFQIGNKGTFISGEVIEVLSDGTRMVNLDGEEYIYDLGELPLPPYIKGFTGDYNDYQTIYAGEYGSIAAPTAGLHFTDNLMNELREHKAEIVFVTLHVGWDTFRSIKSEDIFHHKMHSEFWTISDISAKAISLAKSEKRKIIGVGTTTVRLLENLGNVQQDVYNLNSDSGWADIFITPGHEFKLVDNLITNFHLPKSTLLMLTSAFADRKLIMKAYSEAISENYRFYSFGDAMLIL